jgi:Hemolysins and related proteins containing CBS domains
MLDPDPDRALSLFVFLRANSTAQMPAPPSSSLPPLLLLILLHALFIMGETALVSFNDNKLRKLAQEGTAPAKRIVALLEKPARFRAGVQAGVTLSGFWAAALAGNLFAPLLAALLQSAVPLPARPLWGLCFFLATLLAAYLILLFGDLIPKRIAQKHHEKIAFWLSPLLVFALAILGPFVALLSVSAKVLLGLLGLDSDPQKDEITEEEIRMMVDVGNESGHIEQLEKDMINNVFEFDNRDAGDIMTHRTELIAVPLEASLQDLITLAIESGYSRLPVYKEDLDSIVGIVNIKDLLGLVLEKPEQFSVAHYMRQPLHVLEATTCQDLFVQFQQTRIQVAVVVDEYGGTAGIVTMEDLVETIVGNIQDEYDNEQENIILLEDGSFQVDGLAPMELICRYFQLSIPDEDDFDTIGGYIVSRLGQIPDMDDHAMVRVQDILFTVEEMDERRIATLHLTRITEPDKPPPSPEPSARE